MFYISVKGCPVSVHFHFERFNEHITIFETQKEQSQTSLAFTEKCLRINNTVNNI